AIASAITLIAAALLGRRWVAAGFDGGVRPSRAAELALLALIALVAVATLDAIGALLASALLVVPAVTVRPWASRIASWRRGSVVLAGAEGVGGLWLSVQTDAPPGATVAVLAGAVFAISSLAQGLRRNGGYSSVTSTNA